MIIVKIITKKLTFRNTEGRYTVSFRFKITVPDFGDTSSIALRRLILLERRLSRNEQFYDDYSNVMREYIHKLQIIPAIIISFILLIMQFLNVTLLLLL